MPVQSSNLIPEAPPPSKADEDSKIKAFLDTPALDWQRWVKYPPFLSCGVWCMESSQNGNKYNDNKQLNRNY